MKSIGRYLLSIISTMILLALYVPVSSYASTDFCGTASTSTLLSLYHPCPGSGSYGGSWISYREFVPIEGTTSCQALETTTYYANCGAGPTETDFHSCKRLQGPYQNCAEGPEPPADPDFNSDKSPRTCSSVINNYTQAFTDYIEFQDLGRSLSYSTNRVPDRKTEYSVRLQLRHSTNPPETQGSAWPLPTGSFPAPYSFVATAKEGSQTIIEKELKSEFLTTNLNKTTSVYDVTIYAAGTSETTNYTTVPTSGTNYVIEWSGEDASSNLYPMDVTARIERKDLGAGFYTYTYNDYVNIGTWDARSYGLGGWTFDDHHFLNPYTHRLYRGDGSMEMVDASGALWSKKIGGLESSTTPSGDGGAALSANIGTIDDFLRTPNGKIYLVENGTYDVIRVIDESTGDIDFYAGDDNTSGTDLYNGASTSASSVIFGSIVSMENHGNDLIVLSYYNGYYRVYELSGTTATHIAGKSGMGNTETADGTLSKDTNLPNAKSLGVDQSTGDIFVAHKAEDGSGDDFEIIRELRASDSKTYAAFRVNYYDNEGLSTASLIQSMIVDGDDVYAASPSQILHIDTNADTVTQWGFAGTGDCKVKGTDFNSTCFSNVQDIKLNSDDELVVLEDGVIKRMALEWKGWSFIGGNGVTNGNMPNGAFASELPISSYWGHMALGSSGEIYLGLTKSYKGRVDKLAPLDTSIPKGFIVADSSNDLVYLFDEDGNHVKTKTSMLGATIQTFSYNTNGTIDEIEDAYSNTTSFSYGTNSVTITLPNSQQYDLTLNSDGFLTGLETPLSRTYTMSYKTPSATGWGGLLDSIEYPDTNEKTITYDTYGNLSKVTDPANGYKEFATNDVYKGLLNLSRTLETALGRETVSEMGLDTSTSPYHTTAEETLPTGEEINTRYRADGLYYQAHTSPGDLTKVTLTTDPLYGSLKKNVQNYEEKYKNPSTQTETRTNYVTFSKSVSLNSDPEPWDYASYSQTIVDNTKSTSMSYNLGTKKITISSPESRTSYVEYDSNERITSYEVNSFDPIEYIYLSNGKISEISQGSRDITYGYDSNGFVNSVTNMAGETTTFTNDAEGRPTQITRNDSKVISIAYDNMNNITSITPPSKPAHTFDHTVLNFISEYLPPSLTGVTTPETTYTYNSDNQLDLVTLPTGQTIDYVYNSTTGLLTSIDMGTDSYSFSYQSNSSNLDEATSPDDLTLVHTHEGSFLKTIELEDASSTSIGTVTYSRNNGRPSAISVSGGSGINYTYDNDWLLKKVGNLNIYRVAGKNLPYFTRDTYMDEFYEFDSTYGDLTRTYGKYYATIKYDLNLTYGTTSGRITDKSQFYLGSGTTDYEYEYDSIGRLHKVYIGSSLARTYNYDDNGNRTSLVDDTVSPAVTTSATYDNQDRLLTYGNYTFAYNDNGDLSTKTDTSTTPNDVTTYSYDQFGQLKSVVLPDSSTITYEVDGHGRRASRDDGTDKVYYVYQDQLKVVAKYDDSGTLLQQYVWGTRPNVPEYIIVSGVRYRLIVDHLGSVTMVHRVNSNTVVQEIEYDEFGRVIRDTNPGFQPFGFAGGLYDHETGLVRFGARDYDAEFGRWITKDPIRFDGGFNHYGYTFNNPVNLFDPTGLVPGKNPIDGTILPLPRNPDGQLMPYCFYLPARCSDTDIGTAPNNPLNPNTNREIIENYPPFRIIGLDPDSDFRILPLPLPPDVIQRERRDLLRDELDDC